MRIGDQFAKTTSYRTYPVQAFCCFLTHSRLDPLEEEDRIQIHNIKLDNFVLQKCCALKSKSKSIIGSVSGIPQCNHLCTEQLFDSRALRIANVAGLAFSSVLPVFQLVNTT